MMGVCPGLCKSRCLQKEKLVLNAEVVVVVDFTTLKMVKKPVKLQKERPAGCAGESKQSKGN